MQANKTKEIKELLDEVVMTNIKKDNQIKSIIYRHDALKKVHIDSLNNYLSNCDAGYYLTKKRNSINLVYIIISDNLRKGVLDAINQEV